MKNKNMGVNRNNNKGMNFTIDLSSIINNLVNTIIGLFKKEKKEE